MNESNRFVISNVISLIEEEEEEETLSSVEW